MTTREQALNLAQLIAPGESVFGRWSTRDERTLSTALIESEAENARLRKALDKANIWAGTLRGYMPSHGTYAEDMINLCGSIQHVTSEALATSPAAQPTPEDKPAREWRVRNKHGILYATGSKTESAAREWVDKNSGETLVFSDDGGSTWNDAPTQETK